MYKLFLSIRYLKSRRITYLSIAGVAVSVMALIVVTSVLSGFSTELRERIRGTASHITIRSDRSFANISDYEELLSKTEQAHPSITGSAPRIEWLALVEVPGWRSRRTGLDWVQFVGISPDRESKVSHFHQYLLEDTLAVSKYLLDHNLATDEQIDECISSMRTRPEWKPHGLTATMVEKGYLTLEVAREISTRLREKCLSDLQSGGVIVGNEIFDGMLGEGQTIILTTAHLQSSVKLPVSKSFTVAGTFKSGMYEYDSRLVYMSLKNAQELLSFKADEVTAVAVSLHDYTKSNEVTRILQSTLGASFAVSTWEEEKRNLLQAVEIEKIMQVVILSCITLVAAFGILAILNMMVVEKTRDIGVLKALGGSRSGIAQIFMLDGLFIGLFGGIIGVILGVVVTRNLASIESFLSRMLGIEIFPRNIYYLDQIPTDLRFPAVAAIFICAILVSTIASIYPALKAGRLDPVESLRYE